MRLRPTPKGRGKKPSPWRVVLRGCRRTDAGRSGPSAGRRVHARTSHLAWFFLHDGCAAPPSRSTCFAPQVTADPGRRRW